MLPFTTRTLKICTIVARVLLAIVRGAGDDQVKAIICSLFSEVAVRTSDIAKCFIAA